MDHADLPLLSTAFQVFLIDLLLGGDNAVVIAMACRLVPPAQLRPAMLAGTGLAVLFRVVLTAVASMLLALPFLKLLGALALIVIAVRLVAAEDDDGAKPGGGGGMDLMGAIVVIVVADLAMSVDNVVALAAVAQGSMVTLALGLALSIPFVMFGGFLVVALLNRFPALVALGGAMLGWIAGDIAVADPVIADWVTAQAPALPAVMPALGALFVLLESRIVATDRRGKRAAGRPGPPAAGQPGLTAAMASLTRRRPKPAAAPAATLAAPVAHPSYAPPSAAEALAGGALILVADDNPINQGALRQTLTRLGYATDFAWDGRQALAMLDERRYGLLLTDCHMPQVNGFELATRIREGERASGGHLPIIAIIGADPDGIAAARCLDAGMDECLDRTAPAEALDALVARRLPAALALRRPPPTAATSDRQIVET